MAATAEKQSKLISLVNQVSQSDLASIKHITLQIIKAINNPNASARDIKQIVEIDPPLTAKILRKANSAYYFSQQHIADIEQAVIWIGFDNLKEIVLNQKLAEIFQSEELVHGYSRTMLWKHSLAVATLGKMIYRREFGMRGGDIYAAGLLHDIGIIIIDQFFPADFNNILAEAAEDKGKPRLVEIEEKVVGHNHADIGLAVSLAWQYPPEIAHAIGYHHHPDRAPEESKRIAQCLRLADALGHQLGYGYMIDEIPQDADLEPLLKQLGVKQTGIDLIIDNMRVEFEKMEKHGLFQP